MATKDWKKINHRTWKNGNSKVQVTGLEVKLPYRPAFEFKSNAEAMKFAKSYMRKHSN